MDAMEQTPSAMERVLEDPDHLFLVFSALPDALTVLRGTGQQLMAHPEP